MVAVCELKKLFAGGRALNPELLLKLDVCAGTWKFGELFGGGGSPGPCPVPGLGGNKSLSPPGPGGGGENKLPELLSLLLLFFLPYLFMPFNVSSRFCISNSFPGWLGKDLIK